MKKLSVNMLTAAIVLFITACGSKYSIQGSSSVTALDGHKLYLKIVTPEKMKAIDSCEVIHGEFHFNGSFDSTCMAHLYMDDAHIMPVVLEEGNISLQLDLAQQTSGGTPLNDSLSSFLSQYNQILSQRRELVHRHDQAIMDGSNMDVVYTMLAAEETKLAAQEDSLVTDFITSNYDNALGPGIFFLMTMEQPYPQLTPWVEYIMSKATDNFREDAYVKEYYSKAQENQNIMNGLTSPSTATTQTPPASQTDLPTDRQGEQPADTQE